MHRRILHLLFSLCLVLTVAACDRGGLDEEPPTGGSGGGGGPITDGNCTATIDGTAFEASLPSASINDLDFRLSCSDGGATILFDLNVEGFGPSTVTLGTPTNNVQYSVGNDVTNTVGISTAEIDGTLVFTGFSQDRAIGMFQLSIPGFSEGDPVIRIMDGRFDVPVSLNGGG